LVTIDGLHHALKHNGLATALDACQVELTVSTHCIGQYMHITDDFLCRHNHAEETLATHHLEFRNLIVELLILAVKFTKGYE